MRRATTPVAGEPHDGDNLLDGRRVGGIELALVVRRATGVVARHRRGRAAPTGGIENYGHGHGISSQSHCGQFPPLYQHRRVTASGSPDGALAFPLASTRRRSMDKTPAARPCRSSWRSTARRVQAGESGSWRASSGTSGSRKKQQRECRRSDSACFPADGSRRLGADQGVGPGSSRARRARARFTLVATQTNAVRASSLRRTQ
jgi:hypothetical protein